MPGLDEHDGVHRIRLENDEFEGKNNAYLLTGDGPTTLVDTGVATDEVRAQLDRGLDHHGVAVTDIDAVVLTHWHQDHSGLAAHVQAAADATVYVHEADAPVIGRDPEAWAEMDALRERRFAEWNVPEADREMLAEIFAAAVRSGGDTPRVEPIAAGDTLPAGDDTLRVIHAPGHTAGLIALAIEDTGEAFVGDAVLPQYTPNVGGADLRVDRPLATYVDTLERLEAEGFDRLHPGHRDPIEAPDERIRTILDHHRERTRRVVSVLDDLGSATPWAVSEQLFGDLEGIHILHGPGESWAHLDHLEAHGAVARSGDAYRLEASPDEALTAI